MMSRFCYQASGSYEGELEEKLLTELSPSVTKSIMVA